MNNPTKRMVYLSFLIALSIILTRLLSLRIAIGGVEGIRIGLGGLPVIMAGVLFGPLAGGLVGAVSDVLGFVINPMGAYMPHFTLTSFLTGFIPGFIVYYIFKKKINYLTLFIAISIGQTITSIILVPVFLEMLFGVPIIEATMIPRIIGQLIHIPIYAYVIKVLLRYDPIRNNCIECNITG
ncbi:MAG: folate family ECF transporter S component [Halanaerobiales bacterium]